MNDLLLDVKNGAAYSPSDLEMGVRELPSTQNESMEEFQRAADGIRMDMNQITELLDKITEMHESSKTMIKTKEMQKAREDMQGCIDQVNMLAKTAKAKLDGLHKANDAAKKVKGQGPGSASERARTSITASLGKKLKELMGEFSSLRTRIQEEYREVVERRVYTVTGEHVAPTEIDKMIETGQSEQLFKNAITGRGQVLDTLAEIEERHRAVKDLERSLLELHQMFMDMAVLVDDQGEALENIETQVMRAKDYVQTGTVAIQEAKKLQTNTRKWICVGSIILLLIVIGIVLGVVQPWKYINRSSGQPSAQPSVQPSPLPSPLPSGLPSPQPIGH